MYGLLTLLLALTPPTAAQAPTAQDPAAQAPAVSAERLPAVIDVPSAVYPAAALAEGREASVLLSVTLNASGEVVDAVVTEPAGEGFDEAARQALLGARFTPALDASGAPVGAVIYYRYRFTAATAAALSVEGVLRTASGAPLADHPVRVRSATRASPPPTPRAPSASPA